MPSSSTAEQALLDAFSPHDMRRTYAGNLLDAGADLAIVQKLMGHSIRRPPDYDRRSVACKGAVERLSIPIIPDIVIIQPRITLCQVSAGKSWKLWAKHPLPIGARPFASHVAGQSASKPPVSATIVNAPSAWLRPDTGSFGGVSVAAGSGVSVGIDVMVPIGRGVSVAVALTAGVAVCLCAGVAVGIGVSVGNGVAVSVAVCGGVGV